MIVGCGAADQRLRLARRQRFLQRDVRRRFRVDTAHVVVVRVGVEAVDQRELELGAASMGALMYLIDQEGID